MNKKSKTKEEVLESLKRANKERKLKMAIKAGFPSVEAYLKFLGSKSRTKKVTNAAVDMVIAFDTTGSMSSYIDNVKKHVKELIPTLFKNTPNLKLKIVAFGDYCDMESSTKFGKAYQESSLTNDENELIKFVSNAQNTSGGDGDEFYELVIKKITEETSWRNGKRSVLLIADCNPHEVGYSLSPFVKNAQIDWKVEAKNAAKLGIQFDTLKINESYNWYEELSKITGGISMNFKSANKMSQVVEAASYARGSSVMFAASMDSVMKSGDEELIGVYKSLSKIVD